MSYRSGGQRRASGLRSAAGAALVVLGVLIAVGVGALMIASLSTRRSMRPPSVTAPCPQALLGPSVQTPGESIACFGRASSGSSIDGRGSGDDSPAAACGVAVGC